MTDLEQTVAALQRRLEALEEENAHLRRSAENRLPLDQGTSRRQLLVGGIGMAGALAGGMMASRTAPVAAAASPTATTVQIEQPTRKTLSLTVTVPPLKTRHAVWVDHIWHFESHFTGETPPVVVASAYDDAMEHDLATFCTCGVVIQGTPGAYSARIMVRNVNRSASGVVITALALGQ